MKTPKAATKFKHISCENWEWALCEDPEVSHSNMEESVLYFIGRKYNLF